jgi:hypothetical protein
MTKLGIPTETGMRDIADLEKQQRVRKTRTTFLLIAVRNSYRSAIAPLKPFFGSMCYQIWLIGKAYDP